MALPPPPTKSDSGSFMWVDWYNKLTAYLNNGNSIPWGVVNKAGSALSDLASRAHVQLTSVQGGNATEQYHLTAAQYTGLTPTFTAPTLLNSWVNYGTPYNPAGYYKDASGRVFLRGLVKSGTVGQAIFTLPTGYRPANTELISTVSNGAVGQVTIDNVGNVVANSGSNVWFTLDNCSFVGI